MQITPFRNINFSHLNSFKGLINIGNNNYINTEHIVSIKENVEKVNMVPRINGTKIYTVDKDEHFCQVPTKEVVKAYSEAANAKDIVIKVSQAKKKS